MTAAVTPFDVAATRIYNQPTIATIRTIRASATSAQPTSAQSSERLLSRGIVECFLKIARTEGVYGLYKGTTAVYFRAAPHTLLNLVFWDLYRHAYFRVSGRRPTKTG